MYRGEREKEKEEGIFLCFRTGKGESGRTDSVEETVDGKVGFGA